MSTNKKPTGEAVGKGIRAGSNDANCIKRPIVAGQCALVLSLIERLQPVLSFTLTADHAIPEAAARVHDLRAMGFNIRTTIVPEVEFRGVIRRNVALYSLDSPEWPAPGFLTEGGGDEC